MFTNGCIAMPTLQFQPFIPEIDSRIIGTWLVGFAAILTVISFFNYIIIAVNDKNIKTNFNYLFFFYMYN